MGEECIAGLGAMRIVTRDSSTRNVGLEDGEGVSR